jgi:hypothetical protein
MWGRGPAQRKTKFEKKNKGRVFWPPCQSEAVRAESRLFVRLPVPVKGHRLQLGSVWIRIRSHPERFAFADPDPK